MLFCRLLIFFKSIFGKILSGIPSQCQTDNIVSRPGPTFFQASVCKSFQQTTLGNQELNAHADVSSMARGLNFGRSNHLYSYFVNASSEGFGD